MGKGSLSTRQALREKLFFNRKDLACGKVIGENNIKRVEKDIRLLEYLLKSLKTFDIQEAERELKSMKGDAKDSDEFYEKASQVMGSNLKNY